jgi:proteasome lid subunit RPN8/RPN11
VLKIPKAIFEQIIAHARDARAMRSGIQEACGILAGRDSIPTHIYRVKNVDPNPRIRYFMDPQEQIWVEKNMRHNGLELIAIYHSHPETEAYPSPTDQKLANHSEAHYILISLQDPQNPIIRAFRIQEGKTPEEKNVIEEPLDIV